VRRWSHLIVKAWAFHGLFYQGQSAIGFPHYHLRLRVSIYSIQHQRRIANRMITGTGGARSGLPSVPATSSAARWRQLGLIFTIPARRIASRRGAVAHQEFGASGFAEAFYPDPALDSFT